MNHVYSYLWLFIGDFTEWPRGLTVNSGKQTRGQCNFIVIAILDNVIATVDSKLIEYSGEYVK